MEHVVNIYSSLTSENNKTVFVTHLSILSRRGEGDGGKAGHRAGI